MDALTKILVALYEEPDKPVDAMEYPFTEVASFVMFTYVTTYTKTIKSF